MNINPDIDVIMQHKYGVSIHNHFGSGILISGVIYTDIEFNFTLIAEAVGEVIGITHLIDFEQTNEVA